MMMSGGPRRGEPVRVGVIDSGWDRSIVDDRVASGIGLVGDGEGFDLSPSLDDHDRIGHGTACADIVLQVAPEAQIVPIRVFGSRLETSPTVLIAAIEWAVTQRIPLVNLSLTTTRGDTLRALYIACERARRAGIILVAAGGGRGQRLPAIFEPVIGVDESRTAHGLDVEYRIGEALECGACGTRRARGAGGVPGSVRGSSFAAPVVTGHIANHLRAAPGASLEQIRAMLSRAGRANKERLPIADSSLELRTEGDPL